MKAKNDYFRMLEVLADYPVRAAELLHGFLTDFHPEGLDACREAIHAIEHQADVARHETMNKLAREFITPIERDDIMQLVQTLDDVTDAVDDVTIHLYMYCVRKLPADAGKLSETVLKCVRGLRAAVGELREFKKSEKLHGLIVEVNNVESEADRLYIAAVRSLFLSGGDPLMVMGVHKVFECLENCCDLCESACDVIDNAVMNNT